MLVIPLTAFAGVVAIAVSIAGTDLGLAGVLTLATALVILGAGVALLWERRRRAERVHARWFAMSNELLCEANLEGRFTRLNEQWQHALGWTTGELTARPYVEFVHPDDRDATAAAMAPMAAAPAQVVDFECRFKAKDGSWRSLLWTARSDRQRIYAVAKDITERKLREDQLLQEQKLNSIGRLAGGVAHDFNNLLTVIIGNANFARDILDGGPGTSEIDQIESHSARAARLTTQLLAYARKQTLRLADLDITEVISTSMPTLRSLVEPDVELTLTTEDTLPLVRADRRQIEVVVRELVSNARDATPPGGLISITISTAATPNGREVVVAIADTGDGMDDQTLEQAFEPFFTTRGVAPGLGLGLCTVDGIVAQSGGSMQLRSQPAVGTTVEVRLPISPLTAAGDSPPAPARRFARAQQTIVVCDDEPGVCGLMERVLTTHGYTVHVATEPEQAIALAARHGTQIDALITDAVMPQMSGHALAKRLLAVLPDLKVIYTSGSSISHASLSAGAPVPPGAPYLYKPFTPNDLLDAIGLLLRSTADGADQGRRSAMSKS